MARIRLRAKGTTALVPTPPAALIMGGDASPVKSRMGNYSGATLTNVIPPVVETINLGTYVPPPQNPLWVNIPAGIKPTKRCANC